LIGKTLAHYEITAKLGQGGMGEVYRARDTKLGRDVAIKVLPREMSDDPERVSRFHREARTLASLQHPNVASIYGFEDLPDARFLVMELVEGEDLSERMNAGALPADEVISIGSQICEGLAAAHDRGIVHRDLKPANIKLMADGTIKILDFGLARAYVGDEGEEGDLANSPTITAAMTAAGVILGTAAYMSPEQARGKTVNQVADIWALGVILWELLLGKRLFDGDTVSDTLAAVLKSPLDPDELPSSTPANLRAVVGRCLQRDPRERFQHAGDVRWAMADAGFGGASSGQPEAQPVKPPWSWIGVTVALAAVAAFGLLHDGSPDTAQVPAPLVKMVHTIPHDPDAPNEFVEASFAPDGRSFAFSGPEGITIRDLGDLQTRVLPDTRNARLPFWSPDGEWIGYVQSNRLMKKPVAGGTATPVINSLSSAVQTSQLEGNPQWTADGTIELGTGNTGIYSVSDRGGEATICVPLEEPDSDFHALVRLPGGERFVVVHLENSGFGYIDFIDREGHRERILSVDGGSVFDLAWSSTGHLIYQATHPTDGLWALPFSIEDGAATGQPFLVVAGGSDPSVSVDGTLVYAEARSQRSQELVWVDREGNRMDLIAEVQTTRPFPAISDDDSQIAMAITADTGRVIAVWDANRAGIAQTLTTDGRSYDMVRWAPMQDELIAYSVSPFEVLRVSTLDGKSEPVLAHRAILPMWTNDEETLVFTKMADEGFSGNLFTWKSGSEDSDVVEFLDRPGIQWMAEPSPNGNYLAYASDEQGEEHIYVTTFPRPGARWRISDARGSVPRWSSDGTQLYWTERYAIMASDVTYSGSGIDFSPPRKLFDRRPINWDGAYFDGFDVSSDDSRFVVVEPSGSERTEPTRIVIVQNWIREFE
jgi:serine/threonine protein kinase